MNENKTKNERWTKSKKETLKDKKSNQLNFKTIDLNILDKTPISKLLTFSARELFQIQEQASLEFEKADYRKKWIEGVIELKYKTTIESAYKRAVEYFNSEPLIELDKYNEDILTEYIQDTDYKDNKNNQINKYNQSNEDKYNNSKNNESDNSIIKVEFYRSIFDANTSNTLERPRIRKRFTLVKIGGKPCLKI